MKPIIVIILIISFIPSVVSAEVFYLRNGEKFKAEIIEEKPEVFIVRKEGERYNFIFEHHEIPKEDLFTVINENGEIIFPMVLDRKVTILETNKRISLEKLSDNQYRNYFIHQTYMEQKELSDAVKDIRNIMLLQIAIFIAGGVVISLAS